MIPGITGVNLDLTSHCDRRCPQCCAGVGINRKLQHHPWEYFERAAAVLRGIDRIDLTGGEPTLHPQFAEFVPRFKALFGCKTLGLVTDGWGVVKHSSVIAEHIDVVHFTRYHGKPAAEAALHRMESLVKVQLSIFDAGDNTSNFTPRSPVGGGKPCYRAWWRSGQIAYADGRIFGCCVAPGIEGAASVLPVIGERIDIPNPPCEKCWWSE